jgi:hypothetical protein
MLIKVGKLGTRDVYFSTSTNINDKIEHEGEIYRGYVTQVSLHHKCDDKHGAYYPTFARFHYSSSDYMPEDRAPFGTLVPACAGGRKITQWRLLRVEQMDALDLYDARVLLALTSKILDMVSATTTNEIYDSANGEALQIMLTVLAKIGIQQIAYSIQLSSYVELPAGKWVLEYNG